MSYNIDLSGRVALVTGASSGLGAQFARTLAKAGAGVALAGRRVERLKTLRAEIEAEGGDARVVALDATDHDSKTSVSGARIIGSWPVDISRNVQPGSRRTRAHEAACRRR